MGVGCCCCFLEEVDDFDRSELIDRRAFNFFPPVVGVVNDGDIDSSLGDCGCVWVFNLPKNPLEGFLEIAGLWFWFWLLLSLRVSGKVLLLSNRPSKSPKSSYALNVLFILGLGGCCSSIDDEDCFLLEDIGEAVWAVYPMPSQAIVGGFPIIHVCNFHSAA